MACAAGYATPGIRRSFDHAAKSLVELSNCINEGVMYIGAHWKSPGLELYDTESWSQPEVDASASEEVMAGELSPLLKLHLA